jgi:hypothetical protein
VKDLDCACCAGFMTGQVLRLDQTTGGLPTGCDGPLF